MIGNDWDQLLEAEFRKDYFRELTENIKEEYRKYRCYPAINEVFNAFRYSSCEKTKVVIMGQDPITDPTYGSFVFRPLRSSFPPAA